MKVRTKKVQDVKVGDKVLVRRFDRTGKKMKEVAIQVTRVDDKWTPKGVTLWLGPVGRPSSPTFYLRDHAVRVLV